MDRLRYINRGLVVILCTFFTVLLGSVVYLIIVLVGERSFLTQGQADVVSVFTLQDLQLNVKTAESSVRGFVLSGNPSLLSGYNSSLPLIQRDISAIQTDSQLAGVKSQTTNIIALVNQRLADFKTSVSTRQSNDLATTLSILANLHGEQSSDALSKEIQTLELTAYKSLNPQEDSVKHNIRDALFILPIIVIFVLAVITFIIYYFQRAISNERAIEGAKNEFLSLASHQLRTPATNVKQYLNLLLDGYFGELSEDQRTAVKIADKNNETEINIMNELLSIAKLDLNKIAIEKQPTDINKLIQHVVDDCKSKADAKGQTIIFRSKRTPEVAVDPIYFRTVIENLVDNASKYSPERGRIQVTTTLKPNSLILSVKDNGVGISKDDIPKLFKKFSRIPNVYTNSVDGSGLGLYWAYRIVELHHGDINVVSKLNKGTEFRVIVPLDDFDNE